MSTKPSELDTMRFNEFGTPKISGEYKLTPCALEEISGSVPDKQKSTKKDEGKTQLQLIDPHFIEVLGKAMTMGAKKHGPNGYKKGGILLEYIGAAMRHFMSIAKGEFIDADSNLPHHALVAANMMIIGWMLRNPNKVDKSLNND